MVSIDPAKNSDSIDRVLAEFQSVRLRYVRDLIAVLPWVMLLGVVSLIIISLWGPFSRVISFSPAGVMYITGTAAAALCFLGFRVLMERIPNALRSLWSRQIIPQFDAVSSGGEVDENPGQSEITLREKEYIAFVVEFERWLNHRGQWVVGAFFALLAIVWTTFIAGFPSDLWTVLLSVIEYPLAFFLGVLAWRIVANGIQIWSLRKKFDLTPLPAHPDRCGGFESIGNVCQWNAFLFSMAGMHLGGWIIVGIILDPSDGTCQGRMLLRGGELVHSYGCQAIFWLPTYVLLLLLVPISLATIGFVLPVWGLHKMMVEKKAGHLRQLDKLGKQIDDLEKEMLENANLLEPGKAEEMADTLKMNRQIYQQSKKYPVWPFNLGIYIKFTLAQAVPVLSLIVSIVVPLWRG